MSLPQLQLYRSASSFHCILTVIQDNMKYVFDIPDDSGCYIHISIVDHPRVSLGTLDCYRVLSEYPLTIEPCNRDHHGDRILEENRTSVPNLVDINDHLKSRLTSEGLYAQFLGGQSTGL